MKLFQLRIIFLFTKRSIENAATLFTRGQPISSVPGEQTKEHPLTSLATHRRQRAIRGQVSFNPINFHDTLHGTHSSTTRIFPRSLGIGPSTRGTGGGFGATPSPFSHYHRRLLFSKEPVKSFCRTLARREEERKRGEGPFCDLADMLNWSWTIREEGLVQARDQRRSCGGVYTRLDSWKRSSRRS